MSNKVNYEWVIETRRTKHGDIIDLDFGDKISDFREDDFEPIDGCVKATMLLVRDEYTDHEGVLDRTQALPKRRTASLPSATGVRRETSTIRSYGANIQT